MSEERSDFEEFGVLAESCSLPSRHKVTPADPTAAVPKICDTVQRDLVSRLEEADVQEAFPSDSSMFLT
jgi:hypothetical protein